MEICFCLWTNRIDLTEYVNSDIHWAGLAGKAQNPCARSFVKVADRFP